MLQVWLSYPDLVRCMPSLGCFKASTNLAKIENLAKYFTGQEITTVVIWHPNLSLISPVRGKVFFLYCAHFRPCYFIWGILAILFYLIYHFYIISYGLKQ